MGIDAAGFIDDGDSPDVIGIPCLGTTYRSPKS